MNERDKELWEKSQQWDSSDDGRGKLKILESVEKFADLIRAEEREAIAQMFEGAPALIPFAQNDKGGCMVCGFTPKLAMEAIRARGNT